MQDCRTTGTRQTNRVALKTHCRYPPSAKSRPGLRMHSSSVLIVHPSADRFRLPDMANGKLSAARHYTLESPSLTSPPGYDPLMEQKPPLGLSMSMPMPSTTGCMQTVSSPQFHSFNPQFVMAPTAPPGLLHISKFGRRFREQ